MYGDIIPPTLKLFGHRDFDKANWLNLGVGKSLARTDVSSLSVPTVVSVPKSVGDAGALLSAGQWGTAAVVFAFTEEGTGGPRTVSKVTQLSLREFSELGIRGLKSVNSVRKYRQAWQHAIDEGWSKAAEPGKRCILPEQDFEFPKLVHETPETPPAPPGKYETIVVDPPWPMQIIEREVRPNQVQMPYAVMAAPRARA